MATAGVIVIINNACSSRRARQSQQSLAHSEFTGWGMLDGLFVKIRGNENESCRRFQMEGDVKIRRWGGARKHAGIHVDTLTYRY